MPKKQQKCSNGNIKPARQSDGESEVVADLIGFGLGFDSCSFGLKWVNRIWSWHSKLWLWAWPSNQSWASVHELIEELVCGRRGRQAADCWHFVRQFHSVLHVRTPASSSLSRSLAPSLSLFWGNDCSRAQKSWLSYGFDRIPMLRRRCLQSMFNSKAARAKTAAAKTTITPPSPSPPPRLWVCLSSWCVFVINEQISNDVE